MPCYTPIKGWKSKELTKAGKRKIVFKKEDALLDMPMEIACGQCLGCRLDRSREWAIRCVHEASMHEKNCFITLTYDDQNLPKNNSLVLEDFQKFIKRFRKKINKKILYFHCGEYGDDNGRPHYHACIFGYDFEDKKVWRMSRDNPLYTSESLNKLWPFGYSIIGTVTFKSAAYVARYIMKKVTGQKAEEHYQGKIPEYTTMSRNPGIGKGWIEKYSLNVLKDDLIIIDGVKHHAPKFYDKYLKDLHPEKFKITEYRRQKSAEDLKKKGEFHDRRLITKSKLAQIRAKMLIRKMENEDGNILI